MNKTAITVALENLTRDTIIGVIKHIANNGEHNLNLLREGDKMDTNYLYGYRAAIFDMVDMLSGWLEETGEE